MTIVKQWFCSHHKSPCHSTIHKCVNYQSFLIFKDASLKNTFLRHRAIDLSSSCEELGRAPQIIGWSWLSSTVHWGQSVLYAYSSQKFIYIYMYLYVFTNCTYLHDLIEYWIVEIRTPFIKAFTSCPSVIFLCKLELPRVRRKLKTVHIAEATIHC